MAAFQILDKENNAIGILELDKEVCELWGVPVHPKRYAMENPREYYPEGIKGEFDFYSQSNWYDTIGWMIASENKSFEDIIEYYRETFKKFIGKKDEEGNLITLEYIIPKRMLLLNTWIGKGYQPKQIAD